MVAFALRRLSDQSASFLASDGVRVAYRHWVSDGPAPLVVLLHGFASTVEEEWIESGVADALIDGHLGVVAVDVRGHGASDAPHDRSAYGESRMALDLLELADVLGAPTIDLVGYSMGAISALVAAAAHPRRVRRVVVGGVGSGVVEVGGLDSRVVEPEELAQAFGATDLGQISDPFLAEWRRAVDATGADHLALAAVAGAAGQLPVDVRSVEAPTLVLAGVTDPLASRPEVLVDELRDGHLVVLDGDHTTARYDPRFASLIKEFLS